ncbi:MAG: NAD-dependent epimerase/dehydratase family protein [Elusimicrobia bacterium]|nr:NAD-dependent epimerase/dehydratase family protein [Elusimicrobiota bacterium]
MKKIAVTGATGFVGYHVAKKLAEKGWGEIVCLARSTSDTRFLKTLPVKIVEGDLLEKKSLGPFLEGCEILFHVAADYRLWARNGTEIVEHNVRGTENVLESAQERNVKKIVVTSSVSAVGRPEHGVTRAGYETLSAEQRIQWEKNFSGNETMDPTPSQLVGPYTKSKYLAEIVARKFASSGAPVVIVNPSTPIGSHDAKPTPTGKLVLDFLNRKMPAYLDTGLNLVDVEDVAEGHLLAAERGKIGERYILGCKNLMLREIFLLLEKITGLPAPKFKIPYGIAYLAGLCSTSLASWTGHAPAIPLDGVRMAKEVMFYDSSKAVKELGFRTGPVESALEKSVRFFRNS